jgi:hypothetical protein
MITESNVSKEILQQLTQPSSTKNIGLLDGLAGECLYYFYRGEILNEEVAYEIAVAKLHETIEMMSETQVSTSFFNGISGIGWMLCHLKEAEIVALDIEDFFDTAVDTLLYEHMLELLNTNVFDFFHGASGICFYFLKRYQTTQNTSLKTTYQTYITHFLFHLEYLSLKTENGLYWPQPLASVESDLIEYRLSGNNQNTALLMVLSEIAKAVDFNPICLPLLKKSSNWLLHEVEQQRGIRMDQAFCLWKVSNVLNDFTLEEKSLQLLKEISVRLSQENYNSLSKYALIYRKVAQKTDDLFFYTKAQECFQIVTNYILDGALEDHSIWKGYAGIGLTNFSVYHHLNLNWAHCMLI